MESHPQPTSREPGSSGSEVTEKGEPVLEVSGGISVDLVYGRRHEHMQDLENAGTGAQDLQWQHLTGGTATQPIQEIGKLRHRLALHADDPVSRTQSGTRGSRTCHDLLHARIPVATGQSCSRARRRGKGAMPADTPRLARRTRPWRISSMATHCAVLMATANARPCAEGIAAVFTPITRPALSSSGPPELPGLSAASV